MPDMTSGIQTALSSLLANSQEIQIIEHNVANVNTPGYHKQDGILATALPKPVNGWAPGVGAGQQGEGVTVETIQRYSNNFLDTRFRAATGEASDWDARSQVLGQLQDITSETGDNGLAAQLTQFWASWSSLANDPTNQSIRSQIMDQASALADTFNGRASQLKQLQSDQNQAIATQVTQVNTTASQVANLNKEITRLTALGQQPNDLLDQRDQLLDTLAGAAGATSSLQADGSVIVSVGGHTLVSAGNANPLQTSPDPGKPGMFQVTWKDGQALDAPSGTLNGLFTARDKDIPAQLTALNQLAGQVATSINTLHTGGVAPNGATGLDFFDSTALVAGDEAATLRVNPNLDAASIATAQNGGQPGDSTIAAQIAALGTSPAMGGTTFNDFINTQATTLANDLNRAQSNSSRNSQVLQALTTQRASETGVSLDEEAANLTKYQRAYEAAARIMTAYDSMLSTIINGIGTSAGS